VFAVCVGICRVCYLSKIVREFTLLEDKIRHLCTKVLATDDPLELQAIAKELQQAIHRHVSEILERAHQRAIAQIQPLQGSSEGLSSDPHVIVHNDAAKGPQL
jgi:hypothetical protein